MPGYRRRASHAGSWYSRDAQELGGQLDAWLAAAASDGSGCRVRAIIAPHAGYSYSGPTAAYAYAQMDPAAIQRVFVLGPSHHVYLGGCALSTAEKLETPVGDLTVDRAVVDALMATGKFEEMTASIDEAEHSIEMHLPYIAKVMAGRSFTVVTIMVGATGERDEAEYGALLAPYLDDPANFFVISSDFCHWGSRFRYQPYDKKHGAHIHEYIDWLDKQGMALIEAQDVAGFYAYLEAHRNTICGRHPIGVFLHSLKRSEAAFRVAFVRYAQSSAVESKADSSVSYASAVIEQQSGDGGGSSNA